MKIIKAIVIDDDRTQRELIENYIKETDYVELLGSFDNAVKALKYLGKSSIHLIFLDIEMPLMSGIEFLQTVNADSKVVLVTAKKEYAVKSYEYKVADYLLKPVSYARFLQTLDKVRNDIKGGEETEPINDSIFVKVKGLFKKIIVQEILFIQAANEYVEIVTQGRKYLVSMSMTKILEKLGEFDFVRVHRSYIIRIDKVDEIDGSCFLIGKKMIPISKSFKEDVLQRFNLV